ncbi:hypothetical protein SALBM135S_04120 [Streptomyces alboniger]
MIVAMDVRPRESRCSTAAHAPAKLSESTEGSGSSAERRPLITAGISSCESRSGSGSWACTETRSTPSTRWAARYWARRCRLRSLPAKISRSCISVSPSSAPTPRRTSEKYGSAKKRVSGSGTTRAMASVRLAARARAAVLGT